MNPQITMLRSTGIEVRFPIVDNLAFRTAGRQSPALHADPVDLVQDTTLDAAERDRQDSLAFLHKLVMG